MLRFESVPALALCLAAGLAGCASPKLAEEAAAETPGGNPAAAAAPTEEADADGDWAEAAEDAEAAAEKLAREIGELEFKLAQSTMELQSTAIQIELDLDGAEAAVADATVDVKEKQLALETYRELESKHELDTSKLSLDRASNRAMEAAQELAELQSMYDVEEFAEKTKELVISRGERNLAMSQRQLDLQNRSFAHLEGWTIPKKLRSLERELLQAERKLARCWSALTDGHAVVARQALVEAGEALVQAQDAWDRAERS